MRRVAGGAVLEPEGDVDDALALDCIGFRPDAAARVYIGADRAGGEGGDVGALGGRDRGDCAGEMTHIAAPERLAEQPRRLALQEQQQFETAEAAAGENETACVY